MPLNPIINYSHLFEGTDREWTKSSLSNTHPTAELLLRKINSGFLSATENGRSTTQRGEKTIVGKDFEPS